MMNLNEALDYIHNLYRKGSVPGLHRMQQMLEMMGNPQKKLKFIHIAGTNGKGSTAAMTASILCKAGYKAGLFTSPYIYRFHERIQMDGQQISDEKLLPLMKERLDKYSIYICIFVPRDSDFSSRHEEACQRYISFVSGDIHTYYARTALR